MLGSQRASSVLACKKDLSLSKERCGTASEGSVGCNILGIPIPGGCRACG